MLCECGVSGWVLLWVVPSFASWLAISLPKIQMHTLTNCIVILCLGHRIWWTMAKISSLLGRL